jgi:hypothetical protein
VNDETNTQPEPAAGSSSGVVLEHTTADVHPDTAPEEAEDSSDDKAMNAEAAKWRRRLRETQAELEKTAAQLDAVHRQQVELMLADTGVKPAAVWTVTDVAELLGDDGAIDTEKVTAAVETARERFGIPKRATGNHVPGVGNQPSVLPKGDTWTQAFAPGKRR